MTGPLARIVHRIPGRTRLRAPAIKGDTVALDVLRTALEDTSGVRAVSVNVLTGSLLVEHEASIEDVLADVARRGCVRLGREYREPYLKQIQRALEESDARLRALTEGRIDMEMLTFLAFLAGGLYQVARGQGLPAGITLLRYALQIVRASGADGAEVSQAEPGAPAQ